MPWQKILLRVKGVEGTQAVSVSAVLAVRLGRAAKAVDAAVMRLWFTGDSLPILVELPGATETVTGVVMPSRWNLDANAPYGEAG